MLEKTLAQSQTERKRAANPFGCGLPQGALVHIPGAIRVAAAAFFPSALLFEKSGLFPAEFLLNREVFFTAVIRAGLMGDVCLGIDEKLELIQLLEHEHEDCSDREAQA
jgi:hypothetical protein